MTEDKDKHLNIMMVAGEHSGDILAAGLIKELKRIYPKATFSGIGGQRMISEGFQTFYPMSKLSVFGLFEVIRHLPELLGIRKKLKAHILESTPDVFIGIDAPDFNLKLERDLYQAGIKTVHYVSPTVWAWRPKRIKKLIGSLNALLCIFPFEETYFKGTAVPAHFIGHPLADKLSVNKLTQSSVREGLGVSISTTVLTLMPGSRLGEVQRHALIFIQAAKICSEHLDGLKVLVPLADKATEELFREIYQSSGITLDLEIVLGESSSAISAADTVLVASGTATLEVMLLKKPMVVAYKLSTLTAWVIRYFKLLKARYVSMPNLIANKPLVKEFLQESVTPDALAEELLRLMTDKKDSALMTEQFAKMAGQLALNTDHQAATIVSEVISQRRSS